MTRRSSLRALKAPGARGNLRDRNAAGIVDVERDLLHFAHRVSDVMKIGLVMSPRRILYEATPTVPR